MFALCSDICEQEMLFVTVSVCGGLTLDGCQVSAEVSPSLLSSSRHRREKIPWKAFGSR